jgi:hypothetical protein
MKKLFTLSFLLLALTSYGQRVELSEIHSGKDDETSVRMHVKEVIPFDGKSIAELHQMMEDWYTKTYVSKHIIYRYTFSYTNGDNEWKEIHDYLPGKGAFKPYDANTEDRILTPHIKCEDCLMAYKNARIKNDGYFKLDLRIKEGKVQLVLLKPYDVSADAYLSLWLIKRKALVKRPDPRLDALEALFQDVKSSLVEFSLEYDGKLEVPEIKEEKKGVDDW